MKVFFIEHCQPGGAAIIFPKSARNQNWTPLFSIKKLPLPLLSVSEILFGCTVLELWIFCCQRPEKWKIVICSFFFLFFEWEKFFLLWVTFFPSQGSKQLAREANFVMSSRRRDITKASRANCFLPSEGKKVTNSKKNFEHSKKREKKMNRLLF